MKKLSISARLKRRMFARRLARHYAQQFRQAGIRPNQNVIYVLWPTGRESIYPFCFRNVVALELRRNEENALFNFVGRFPEIIRIRRDRQISGSYDFLFRHIEWLMQTLGPRWWTVSRNGVRERRSSSVRRGRAFLSSVAVRSLPAQLSGNGWRGAK